MNKRFVILPVFFLVLLCGCSLQDTADSSQVIASDNSSAIIDDRADPDGRTDITAIVSFLDKYNRSVETGLQMSDYEVAHERDLDVFYVTNGVFTIVFKLDEDGKVLSALYQDGLSRADRDKVAMALIKILAADGSMSSLQGETAEKRMKNDAYTQELVDAIESFGSIGTPPSSNPEVSLDKSEMKELEMFSQKDLKSPQVEAPTGTVPAKNPNEPNLPEIGNFGKMP